MSTLIRNGTVVNADRSIAADVLVEGDAHTHLDMPFGGATSSDDFNTGTRASVFGRRRLPMSTLIRNGTVVNADGSVLADVLVEGDAHTHLDMPFAGATSSDDFNTGTRASVFGKGNDCR